MRNRGGFEGSYKVRPIAWSRKMAAAAAIAIVGVLGSGLSLGATPAVAATDAVAGASAAAAATASTAAGVPVAPTAIYHEDFEVSPNGSAAPALVSTAFPSFRESAGWVNPRACNGIWLTGQPVTNGFSTCNDTTQNGGYSGIRGLATALGGGNANNHAVSSYTHNGVAIPASPNNV